MRQEFGIAAYVAPPVLHTESAFVHGAFTDHDEWPASGRPRVAHAVRLAGVTVVHLHGLRDAAGKGDTPARLAQADAIAALVTRVRQRRRPGRRLR